MASDSGKPLDKKPRVVETAEASKNWKGAYVANFNCPKCRSPLSSQDDALLGSDTCPNCKAVFVFGAGVQTPYRAHRAALERKEAEKRQVAEEKAQATEEERQRLAEVQRSIVQRKIAEKKSYDRERNERVSARRTNLKWVEIGISTVNVLSLIGSVILIGLGIANLGSNNPFQERAAETLLTWGMASLVSLLLIWGLFRCLFAIHQLLTDISAKLDRDGD